MKLKDLLAKVAKKEQLTEDETKFLASYDPETETNNAAAAARRKAEDEAAAAKKAQADLQAQFEGLQKQLADAGKAKMSDAEKATQALTDLQKQMAELNKRYEASETEKKQLARQAKVNAVLDASGIKFVDGVDHKILRSALAGTLQSITDDNLADNNVIGPILDNFKTSNKAVIADTSGHGAGSDPARRVELGRDGKPIDKMSADERATDLKKRGII